MTVSAATHDEDRRTLLRDMFDLVGDTDPVDVEVPFDQAPLKGCLQTSVAWAIRKGFLEEVPVGGRCSLTRSGWRRVVDTLLSPEERAKHLARWDRLTAVLKGAVKDRQSAELLLADVAAEAEVPVDWAFVAIESGWYAAARGSERVYEPELDGNFIVVPGEFGCPR